MSTDYSRYVQLIDTLSVKMRAYDFDEVEIIDGSFQVRVKRASANAGIAGASALPADTALASIDSPSPDTAQSPLSDGDTISITAEMSGIVHLQPSPGADPFVTVGSSVSKGQDLCLIEAMKLFSPQLSSVAGTITAILIENAQEVSYGDPLFTIMLDAQAKQ